MPEKSSLNIVSYCNIKHEYISEENPININKNIIEEDEGNIIYLALD